MPLPLPRKSPTCFSMNRRVAAAILAYAGLAACDGAPQETGPATASVGEQEALRDAAEVIEQRPIPADVMAAETGAETGVETIEAAEDTAE